MKLIMENWKRFLNEVRLEEFTKEEVRAILAQGEKAKREPETKTEELEDEPAVVTEVEAQKPQKVSDETLRELLLDLNGLSAQSEDLSQLFFTTDREAPLETLRKNVRLLFVRRLHTALYDFHRPGHEESRPAFDREERQLLAQTAISNSKEEFDRVLTDLSKRYEPVAADRARARAGR